MSNFINKIVNGENLQLFARKIKQHIFEDLLGGKKIRYITQAEYNVLTDDQKNNENIVWNITDEDIDLTIMQVQYITQAEYQELANSGTIDETILYIINDGINS